jgi:hypothetical protein
MQLLALGIGLGLGLGMYRNLPPMEPIQLQVVVFVMCLGLVIAYLAGKRMQQSQWQLQWQEQKQLQEQWQRQRQHQQQAVVVQVLDPLKAAGVASVEAAAAEFDSLSIRQVSEHQDRFFDVVPVPDGDSPFVGNEEASSLVEQIPRPPQLEEAITIEPDQQQNLTHG